jgi:hypothetical protein
MVTGNGPSHLNEFMATLNSPGLSQPSFSAIETDIGKWWQDVLLADILAAGQEERRLAIERKDYHEEVPAITVITDGGWSKRTHKHSYNAAGGLAIIIGKETKKLLHIGANVISTLFFGNISPPAWYFLSYPRKNRRISISNKPHVP